MPNVGVSKVESPKGLFILWKDGSKTQNIVYQEVIMR